jgi:hypothetical protein
MFSTIYSSSTAVCAMMMNEFCESLIEYLIVDFLPCSSKMTFLVVGKNNECNKYNEVKVSPSTNKLNNYEYIMQSKNVNIKTYFYINWSILLTAVIELHFHHL